MEELLALKKEKVEEHFALKKEMDTLRKEEEGELIPMQIKLMKKEINP